MPLQSLHFCEKTIQTLVENQNVSDGKRTLLVDKLTLDQLNVL